MESLIGKEYSSLIHPAHGGKELGQTKALDGQHSQVTLGFKGELKVVVDLINLCHWLHEGRVQAGGRGRLGGGWRLSCRHGLCCLRARL